MFLCNHWDICLDADTGRHESGQRNPANSAPGGRRNDLQQVADAAAGRYSLYPCW